MYHDVHGSLEAGTHSTAADWLPIRSFRALERFVVNRLQALEDRRRRRSAIRELQRFDDLILRDLGIERSQISEVADAQVAANRC